MQAPGCGLPFLDRLSFGPAHVLQFGGKILYEKVGQMMKLRESPREIDMKKDCSTCVRCGVGGDLCLSCKSEKFEYWEPHPDDINAPADHLVTKCRDPKARYYDAGGIMPSIICLR